MKNIQIIDGAINCVYDIFAATEEEFRLIFAEGTDIAFIDELQDRVPGNELQKAMEGLWSRPVKKSEVRGIHGVIFFEMPHKKPFYPTRRDAEAVNPDGSALRLKS